MHQHRLNHDDDIERDLRELLAVEPSAGFEAQVRLRAAGQKTRPWTAFWWAACAVALGVVVMALLLTPAERTVDVRDNRSADVTLVPAVETVPSAPPSGPQPSPTRPKRPAVAVISNDAPEVLISAADVAAFRGYMEAVNRRQFALTPADIEVLRAATDERRLSPIENDQPDMFNSPQDEPGVQQ